MRGPYKVVLNESSVENSQLSVVERAQLKKSSFFVENWVEFWRWQSQVTKRNGKKLTELCKEDYSETVINPLPGYD
jgi:hypothetical protein